MWPRVVMRVIPLSLLAAALAGCVHLTPPGMRRSRDMMVETLERPDRFWTTDRVLLVGINGVLSAKPKTGGLLSGPSTLVHLKDVLKRAEEDSSIRALLVRIDSPGGSVTASDLHYRELKRFKEKTGKKVVAVCMGVAASGGYYTAMAADSIYLHPTTVTGSIAVIGMFPDLSGVGHKIGFGMRVVKSGELKDLGSPWRSFREGEREVLQATVDAMHERFLEVVGLGRPNLGAEAIRKLADGRVYHAEEAVELGLADEIGYMEDAFERAKELAGVSDAALVAYKQPYTYRGHYYAETLEGAGASLPLRPLEINLLNLGLGGELGLLDGGPFYYLWVP